MFSPVTNVALPPHFRAHCLRSYFIANWQQNTNISILEMFLTVTSDNIMAAASNYLMNLTIILKQVIIPAIILSVGITSAEYFWTIWHIQIFPLMIIFISSLFA